MNLAAILKYAQTTALVVLFVVAVAAYRAKLSAEREQGRAEERSRVADSTLTALAPQLARVDTVYRRDTVTLTRTVTRTIALRDTLLQHLTDTVRVKAFIAQSDSAIHACTEVANTCAQNLRLRDQKIVALEAKLAAQPSTIDATHWYSDRVSIGPYVGVDSHRKASVGLAVQLSLLRFP